jgi:dCTP deaminase
MQVFQTDSSPRAIKELKDAEKIEIKPGQFALLMTQEYLKMPDDRIAFISIKSGVKFKGLVNVSGFHVDPGFEGKLLFSVYNAGPSNIILSNGSPYFPIWFAQLNEHQAYQGNHNKQTRIPDEPIEALSQGELASPNVLSKRIDELKYLKTKIEWAVLAVVTLIIGFSVSVSAKLWTENSKLKEAIEYGYEKKKHEVVADSTINALSHSQSRLQVRFDSLQRYVIDTKK